MNIQKTINKIVNEALEEASDPVGGMVDAVASPIADSIEFVIKENFDLMLDFIYDELSNSYSWDEDALQLENEDIDAVSEIVTQKVLAHRALHDSVKVVAKKMLGMAADTLAGSQDYSKLSR